MNQENLTADHIYSFTKNPGEEVQMALKRYKGRYYVDLRLWFQKEGEETYKPTKKGLFIGAEHLPKIKEGVHQLAQVYFQLGTSKNEAEKTAPRPDFQHRQEQGFRGYRQGPKAPFHKPLQPRNK